MHGDTVASVSKLASLIYIPPNPDVVGSKREFYGSSSRRGARSSSTPQDVKKNITKCFVKKVNCI